MRERLMKNDTYAFLLAQTFKCYKKQLDFTNQDPVIVDYIYPE